MFISIIIFLIMLSILVVVHECGHFFTAKLFNTKILEFAVGMGPKIISKKFGDTFYSLRAIPFGGYVKMEGEEAESDDPRSFSKLKAWKRLLVLLNGALMNFILGFILVLVLTSFAPALASTTVADFINDSDNETVHISDEWLKENDSIIKINGAKVNTYADIGFELALAGKEAVDITVVRENEKVVLKDVKFPMKEHEGMQILCIDFRVYRLEKTVPNVLKTSVYETVSIGKSIYTTLRKLVSGGVSVSQLSGPVGMTQEVNKMVDTNNIKETLLSIMYMLALISINLGIVNLLPLPALDGGRIIFVVYEIIAHKPIPQKYEGMVHMIGFVLLMSLMVFITFSDILKLFR